MATSRTLRITAAPTLRIARRDVIVVEYPGPLVLKEREALERTIKKLWPRNRVLVLTDGAQLKIGVQTHD